MMAVDHIDKEKNGSKKNHPGSDQAIIEKHAGNKTEGASASKPKTSAHKYSPLKDPQLPDSSREPAQVADEVSRSENGVGDASASGGKSNQQPSVVKDAFSDINMLKGVPVALTLSVDSKRMMIADVLKLKPGSVIQFDRREHEPLDISLNGTLFAKGEVVLVGEHYGLRILEIL